jgi:hypothetical protein
MAIEEHVGRLLELRLRLRRNPMLRALADRGLSLVAEAQEAPLGRRVEIEGEVLRILETLEERSTAAEASRH